jgi:large subunit ribosomal protein L30
MSSEKFAAIRIRGKVRVTYGIKKTLDSLNLYRQNWCVILDKDPRTVGMLNKVKDYVTWGEVTEENIKSLFEKRGEPYSGPSGNFVEYNKKKYKMFFRLNPPIGGYERKGTKISFSDGGALGYRKDKINDLIGKMI